MLRALGAPRNPQENEGGGRQGIVSVGQKRGSSHRHVHLDESTEIKADTHIKLARLQEVEQRPQLGDMVLQRRPRKDQLAPRAEVTELVKDA